MSSLLERMNGYNLDQQISALQNLEIQGQEENAMMRQLAEKSSHDSTSVRILTIITLIYLPCTVVSVRDLVLSSVLANRRAEFLLYSVRGKKGLAGRWDEHGVCG